MQKAISASPKPARADGEWWRNGVLYQCYIRSFADSNDDGVGDLRGVRERIEHLAWLGVDALWLSPIHPSPNDDWGYDVADFYGVHPELGTHEDLDDLIAAARAHGIQVLMDLVPNHTSDRHPWFDEARRDHASQRRGYYVWQPAPPNNWVSMFGGPAWTRDEHSGEYYMHNFLPSQPDLNWWNPAVWEEFDAIMRYWLDRGVGGFRIDVAHGIVKDRLLRDNPPADEHDRESWRLRGQKAIYSMNRPDVHAVHARWRRLVEGYDRPLALVGETLVHDLRRLAGFYGDGSDGLHLAFNFVFALADLDVPRLKQIVRDTEALLPDMATPSWLLSNHDLVRFPTRWAGDDMSLTRVLLVLLMTLRGTSILYYGDEIGMSQVTVPHAHRRDARPSGRDGARTPLPWTAQGGFTSADAKPWLPLGGTRSNNVADQRREPTSTLHLVRDLIVLRRSLVDLSTGAYEELPASAECVWSFRRGRDITVALNLGDTDGQVDADGATVLLSSPRGLEGAQIHGSLRLAGRSAIVLYHAAS